ncbi:MAG: hypothetical protein ACKVRP_05380, partial [Bacteroidota bacterium]
MTDKLKYVAYITVAIIALVIVIRISNCTTSLPYVKGRAGEEFTVTPPDSSFSPTDHRTYTPP